MNNTMNRMYDIECVSNDNNYNPDLKLLNGNNTAKHKKLRIKSKFRFITFLVVVIGLLVGTVGYFSGAGTSVAVTKDINEITVEVSSGDTVWDIAAQYKDDDTDIREAVYKICKVNDLEDGCISEGMVLSIPDSL